MRVSHIRIVRNETDDRDRFLKTASNAARKEGTYHFRRQTKCDDTESGINARTKHCNEKKKADVRDGSTRHQ